MGYVGGGGCVCVCVRARSHMWVFSCTSVGKIIGRGGENIAKVQAECNVQITVHKVWHCPCCACHYNTGTFSPDADMCSSVRNSFHL